MHSKPPDKAGSNSQATGLQNKNAAASRAAARLSMDGAKGLFAPVGHEIVDHGGVSEG